MKRICIALTFLFFLFIPNFAPSVAVENKPIVFLIDTSGSMRGEKLNAVKEAVKEVVTNLKPEVSISIFSFNTSVNEVLPTSTDRDLALYALSTLETKGRTSLFDAIDFATSISNSLDPGRIVVLSDGGDTTSQLTYSLLLEKLGSKSIPVDIIGLSVEREVTSQLQGISKVSNGNFYPLSGLNDLIKAYREILKNELVALPTSSSPVEVVVVRNIQTERFLTVLAAVAAFALLISWNLRVRIKRAIEARNKTLEKYVLNASRQSIGKIRQALTQGTFVPKKIEIHIKTQLDLVNSRATYERILQLGAIAWVGTFIAFNLIANSIISIFFAVVLPPLYFRVYINRQLRKQKKNFDNELPEMLNVVSSGLNAGLGLQQSLEAYAIDSTGEVSRQLRRAIGEIRVGTPVDEALLAVAKRMDSEELRWAVTALSIQRLVGGSMATILRTAYETIKSRGEIKREVATLSAEGRLSAQVLMMLPIGIFLFLLIARKEYVQVFWSNPLGIFLMIVIVCGMFIGWTWMKKIVDIKI
jgi:tight adherence protein B